MSVTTYSTHAQCFTKEHSLMYISTILLAAADVGESELADLSL